VLLLGERGEVESAGSSCPDAPAAAAAAAAASGAAVAAVAVTAAEDALPRGTSWPCTEVRLGTTLTWPL